MVENTINLQIATIYLKMVKAWLKRAGVLSGKELGYRADQNPKSKLLDKNWFNTGDALVTTGFCVSVSQALMNSDEFQLLLNSRNARAKLVSIDIKEVFYGVCKPSFIKNKWHTAIYLEDSGCKFIIDPTCAQFGNAYVGKVVWDFKTWCDTFRSDVDAHKLTDFDGNELSWNHVYNRGMSSNVVNQIKRKLTDLATITEHEQEVLADFLVNGIPLFNRKVFSGSLQPTDLTYLNKITKICRTLFTVKSTDYSEIAHLEFDNKEQLLNFVKKLIETRTLPVFLLTNIENRNRLTFHKIENDTYSYERYFIRFEISNCTGLEFSMLNDLSINKLIFQGASISFNPAVDIFNEAFGTDENGVPRSTEKSNTIIIRCSIF